MQIANRLVASRRRRHKRDTYTHTQALSRLPALPTYPAMSFPPLQMYTSVSGVEEEEEEEEPTENCTTRCGF